MSPDYIYKYWKTNLRVHHIMQKNIKELMPQWAMIKQDRNLTLTNDMDSLLLANLLKDLFGYEINHFYSFSEFSTLDKSDQRLSIGCDLALKKGYTFCNHLTMLTSMGYKNTDSVNLNNVLNISNMEYFKKFNLSSLITAWSLYDVPLPKTEEGLMILLCIDSSYMGWRNPKYRYIMRDWLERLEMTELIEVLEKYTQANFNDFKFTHGLDAGITLQDNGELALNLSKKNPYTLTEIDLDWIGKHLGFDVKLPQGQFTTIGSMDSQQINKKQFNKEMLDNTFSMAITFKDEICITTFKRGA